MKFSIRDDDLNFYTTIEDLTSAYGAFFGYIPITFGVIPFVHGSFFKSLEFDCDPQRLKKIRDYEISASADELEDYHRLRGVGSNKELVAFLKKYLMTGKVEIAQHGYSHRFFDDGPELYVNHVDYQRIRDGKEYLEKVFGCEINTFIPPYNVCDYPCFEFVQRLKMNFLSSAGLDFKCNRKKTFFRIRKFISNPGLVWGKTFGNNQSSFYLGKTRIDKSITFDLNFSCDRMLDVISEYSYKTKCISIATHYHALVDNKLYHANFMKLIEEIFKNYPNAEFVTHSSFVSGQQSG